jgi:hypothetical protein
MPALPELQAGVMNALLGRADLASAAPWLRGDGRLTAAQRLQVYRNNLLENGTAALRAVFPVTDQLVGEACFRQMARRFIGAHPSRSGNLHDFGNALPGFVAAADELAGLPYLADVARLEWAWHVAWHAAEWPALTVDALLAVPADQQPALQLRLQPGLTVLRSAYPVLAIWQAHQGGFEPESVRLDAGGIDLLVAAHALDVEFRPLAAGEACWLQALAAGQGLAEASTAALNDSALFDLGAALQRHIGRGVFTELPP